MKMSQSPSGQKFNVSGHVKWFLYFMEGSHFEKTEKKVGVLDP